jgi:para-nitrobenzyl esterase
MHRRDALRALVTGTLASSVVARASAAESPVVSTTAGRIRGFVDANGVLGFKGVPYGADSSSYRFRPPVPVKPWTGVGDALEFGAIAPQPGMRGRVMNEDCPAPECVDTRRAAARGP